MAKSKGIGAKMVIIVFFGIFLSSGIVSLYIALEGANYGYQSKNWANTQGVIDESHITTRTRKKGGKKYALIINYHFNVDGMTYSNDRAQYLDNMFYPRSKKEEIISRYRPGQRALIYYNSANPDQAVLITGFATIAFSGGLAIGLLFSGFGVYGLLLLRI